MTADRFNVGKLKYGLIPWEWLTEMAKIFTKGAMKYAPNNWKKSINTADHDCFKEDRLESAYRHIIAYQMGEVIDSEVVHGAETIDTHHLGHAAWNLLAVMYYDMKEAK